MYFFWSGIISSISPLLIPIILILRLTGEGEIFFLQERIGKGGKPFKLFKFVTMVKDSPNIGTGTVTIKDLGFCRLVNFCANQNDKILPPASKHISGGYECYRTKASYPANL